MPTPITLYDDPLLTLSDSSICFKNYYFPWGDKSVSLAEIENITTQRPSLLNGKYRLHGSSDLTTWFPRDLRRPSRTTIFFAHLRQSFRVIGFTVEDAPRVKHLLRERGLMAGAQ